MEKTAVTDAVIASCGDIFAMMLPLRMSEAMQERPLPERLYAEPVCDDVIASIGITGEANGSIALYMSLQMALDIAGWMMEQVYDTLCSDVLESIGEMINMIAGGIKNRLSSADKDIFDISLPILISGPEKTVFHGKNRYCISVPVETTRELLTIRLVLEKPVN